MPFLLLGNINIGHDISENTKRLIKFSSTYKVSKFAYQSIMCGNIATPKSPRKWEEQQITIPSIWETIFMLPFSAIK